MNRKGKQRRIGNRRKWKKQQQFHLKFVQRTNPLEKYCMCHRQSVLYQADHCIQSQIELWNILTVTVRTMFQLTSECLDAFGTIGCSWLIKTNSLTCGFMWPWTIWRAIYLEILMLIESHAVNRVASYEFWGDEREPSINCWWYCKWGICSASDFFKLIKYVTQFLEICMW